MDRQVAFEEHHEMTLLGAAQSSHNYEVNKQLDIVSYGMSSYTRWQMRGVLQSSRQFWQSL